MTPPIIPALPGAVLRSQARFKRRASLSGRALSLTFSGAYLREARAGVVFRPALGTQATRGFLSLGGVPSALQQEVLQKWGQSFLPDGLAQWGMDAAPPPGAAWGDLARITDGRPGGYVYDVILTLPDSFEEERCRVALVRRLPVYNRLVSVHVRDEIDGKDDVFALTLPCRITPKRSNLAQSGDLGGVQAGAWTMECPPVFAAALPAGAAAGANVLPLTPGQAVLLDPKRAVVVDDPAAYSPTGYGQGGRVTEYRVSGLPLDVGGDSHHLSYDLSLS